MRRKMAYPNESELAGRCVMNTSLKRPRLLWRAANAALASCHKSLNRRRPSGWRSYKARSSRLTIRSRLRRNQTPVIRLRAPAWQLSAIHKDKIRFNIVHLLQGRIELWTTRIQFNSALKSDQWRWMIRGSRWNLSRRIDDAQRQLWWQQNHRLKHQFWKC